MLLKYVCRSSRIRTYLRGPGPRGLCIYLRVFFHNPVLGDMQNEVHRTMFEAVQGWVHSRSDRGSNLDDPASKSGRNHTVRGEDQSYNGMLSSS